MKNKKNILILIIFVCSTNIYSQIFHYNNWGLNTTVSFNDVVNFIKNKSKIITEPTVYIKGEDIKFYDSYNSETTLCFFNNTQILRSISINEITNDYQIKQLQNLIFQQLGDPDWGYEKTTFVNIYEDYIISDYNKYEMEYLYKINNHEISISISALGFRLINKLENDTIDAPFKQGFYFAKEYYKILKKNIFDVQILYSFNARYNETQTYIPKIMLKSPNSNEVDYGWQTSKSKITKQWNDGY